MSPTPYDCRYYVCIRFTQALLSIRVSCCGQPVALHPLSKKDDLHKPGLSTHLPRKTTVTICIIMPLATMKIL